MTERQYLISLIWQTVFIGLIAITVISMIFKGEVTNFDIAVLVLGNGVEIVEEIKQQFYKLKKEKDEERETLSKDN